jgi:hypothetical protein
MAAASKSKDIDYDYSSEEREDDYTADDDNADNYAIEWNAVVVAAAILDSSNAAPMIFIGTQKHDTR